MKISIKNCKDLTLVNIDGYLDLLGTDMLKKGVEEYLAKNKGKKILFNLNGLELIGSTGIKEFVSILEDFYKENSCNLKCICDDTNFIKLFKHNLNNKKIIDDLFENQEAANKIAL